MVIKNACVHQSKVPDMIQTKVRETLVIFIALLKYLFQTLHKSELLASVAVTMHFTRNTNDHMKETSEW